MSRYLYNNINSSSGQDYITIAYERSQILAWLSPLDPRIQHKKVQAMRVDNVGHWFLETEEFRSWCDGSGNCGFDSAVLFCCAHSGVGKTFISSLVIDKLCDQARRQSTVVVCFYLDHASQGEQSPTDVLGSLLKQLVNGLDQIPKEVIDFFRDEKMAIGGRELRFSQIEKLLQNIISSQRTVICIDGLDQCRVRNRLKLLNSLREILKKSLGTRLFLTGKPDIQSEIKTQFDGALTIVSKTSTKGDVISYLCARLDEDPAPDAMDGILKADILNRIPQTMPNVLGLVAIKIDEILRETTILGRQLRLNAMTESNFGLYSEHSTLDPYGSYHTSDFQFIPMGLDDIDPGPTQNRSPSDSSYYTHLASMPQAASPGQLTAATPSPALLPCQGDPPTQATRHSTNQSSSRTHPNLNSPRSSARQHQPPAIGPQGGELYPNQPTHNNGDQDSGARHPSPQGNVCTCGQRILRLTDFRRHLRTSCMHNTPGGPACPEPGCRYTRKFTRIDNFKAHYRKKHGKSGAEADSFIQAWSSHALPPYHG